MVELIKKLFGIKESQEDKEILQTRKNLCKLFNQDPENAYLGSNAALSSLAIEYDGLKKKLFLIINLLIILLLFFVCTTAYLAATKKVVPYVVEVDQNGQVFDLNHSMKLAGKDIQYKLAVSSLSDFIRHAFSVSPDGDVDIYDQSSAIAHTRGAASDFLKNYFSTHDKKTIASKYSISTDINYILPVSNNTIKISWTEQKRDVKSDELISKEKYIGQFTYAWGKRSGTEVIDKYNPLGFYIDFITLNKDNSWERLSY